MTEDNNNQNNSYEAQMKKWGAFALREVMPKIAQISKQPDFGFHGLTHTEQVILFGIDYALSENINPLPVILACALHDCARTTDNSDKGYGNRGHAAKCAPIAFNFLEEYDFGLTENEKEKIINAIANHTDGKNTNEKIAACLWDADRTRLAWEDEPVEWLFSTKRGLEVANPNVKDTYYQQQIQLLQTIINEANEKGEPIYSYILDEQNQTNKQATKYSFKDENRIDSLNTNMIQQTLKSINTQKSTEYADLIVNQIMPILQSYTPIKHQYAYFYDDFLNKDVTEKDYNTYMNLLSQFEQTLLLSADYALLQGINPLPVIWGTAAKCFSKIKKDEFHQNPINFLNNQQIHLNDQLKNQIISALHTSENQESLSINHCINDAFNTIDIWENSSRPSNGMSKHAKIIAYNKKPFFKQLLQKLNSLDKLDTFTQQSIESKYTNNSAPVEISENEPLPMYHSTPFAFDKFNEANIDLTPDIRYALLHANEKKRGNLFFVYKVKLHGIFPLITGDKTSFKKQGINFPMERICKFMGISYPISDKIQFFEEIRESLNKLGKELDPPYYAIKEEFKKNKKSLEKSKNLDKSELLQQIKEKTRELNSIEESLNVKKTTIETLKSFFNRRKDKKERDKKETKKSKLIEEIKKLEQKIKEHEAKYKANMEDLQRSYEEKLDKEKSRCPIFELENHLTNIEKNRLNETDLETHANTTLQLLKEFIENQNAADFLGRVTPRQHLLVDGIKKDGCAIIVGEDDNTPPHYTIFNHDTVELTHRYTLDRFENTKVIRIEKMGSDGKFHEINENSPKESQLNQTATNLIINKNNGFQK